MATRVEDCLSHVQLLAGPLRGGCEAEGRDKTSFWSLLETVDPEAGVQVLHSCREGAISQSSGRQSSEEALEPNRQELADLATVL